MTILLLAGLVFFIVTGAIVGVYVLVAGRSQAALQQTMESRLQEAAGFVPAVKTVRERMIEFCSAFD